MRESKATGHDTTMETRIITRDEKVRILTITFSYVGSEELGWYRIILQCRH